MVLERNGNTLRTAEGNFDDKTRVCSDGWGIKDGKLYNLKANGERTFEYGYHYAFSDSGSSTTTYSSSQIFYNIDLSAAVLASRIQQQVSSDCAVVSMATVEAYLYGATSASEKTTVYNALVSKKNHVPREYTVTVAGDALTLDVKLHLIGDIDGNGKVNVGDVSKLNSHLKGTNVITDAYMLLCANVNGGSLNMGDTVALYGHIKGTKPLY